MESPLECASRVIWAVSHLGTSATYTHSPVYALPGRVSINAAIRQKHGIPPGQPDQWKRAKPVLERLGIMRYEPAVGTFMLVPMAEAEHRMRLARGMAGMRTTSRKQIMPRRAPEA